MFKIGQNWGKIANYPPNAQQRSAPLRTPPPLVSAPQELTLRKIVKINNEGAYLEDKTLIEKGRVFFLLN